MQRLTRLETPVHPRVCGEHSSAVILPSSASGSSPRVRGTHRAPRRAVRDSRFIPACAGNTASSTQSPISWPVHPRVCGEHTIIANAADDLGGSSPRVRGTHIDAVRGTIAMRFIPACAGNTASHHRRPLTRPVHPRVCGEHIASRGGVRRRDGSSPRVRGTRRAVGAMNSTLTVHPRVCGEHRAEPRRRDRGTGSSPRVRGTHVRRVLQAPRVRFIPACAGNTLMSDAGKVRYTVHPRVCGEHGPRRRGSGMCRGSSPRVRGTPFRQGATSSNGRFIPACAGNTMKMFWPSVRRTVHPRVCGEHAQLRRYGFQCKRFIPACAGNTQEITVDWSANTVHPRVCGEHAVPTRALQASHGSSPRVRGTRRWVCTDGCDVRFIPACAGNTACRRWSRATRPVHPRVCGEHGLPCSLLNQQHGSSPRVRGTPRPYILNPIAQRFIPACAGNTLLDSSSFGTLAVHPRVCWEHSPVLALSSSRAGSSPRVRGTRRNGKTYLMAGRFIPACAGNTDTASFAATANAVHPRVCGEHRSARRREGVDGGSSPRVRGTQRPIQDALRRQRFIPACAGNTAPPAPAASPKSVHPRVCGEHIGQSAESRRVRGSSPRVRGTRLGGAAAAAAGAGAGSSPRVRGTLSDGIKRIYQGRFIPACAGNTLALPASPRTFPVHPRVCGEHCWWRSRRRERAGSSPRVRGTRSRRSSSKRPQRFIPACAGNTRTPGRGSITGAVHPRVCGEHVSRYGTDRSDDGSSPRVRGTHRHAAEGAQRRRFIPACAGNTAPRPR